MRNSEAAGVGRVAQRRRWSQADGSLVVRSWRASGQKQAEFARRFGINEQRLSWWIKRAKPEAEAAEVRFHPVRVRAEPLERHGDDRIEIRLGDGRSVHVPGGCAGEALASVLRVLEAGA